MRTRSTLLIPLLLLWSVDSFADTLEVGPDKTLKAPCAAFAAAKDGDTIEIDGTATYTGDVCAVTRNSLTIRGVNGRPKIDSQGANFGDKAIWVVQGHDVSIDNVELTGCVDSDNNGAAIRQEGANLTLRHSFIHDNQDGILTVDDATSTVTIENCEFSKNGAGDGQSHNLYINHVGHFIFRFNYSHDAKVGHLLKSRALNNLIAYNRFSDGQGDASYEVSMPNAGTSYVIGNVIEQTDATGSSTMIDYASEPTGLNSTFDLYVVNNTLVSTRTNGALFVSVGTLATTNAQILNNIFNGKGTVTQQATAVQTTNYSGDAPKFASAANADYHLTEGSPCENAGTMPTTAGAQSLVPMFDYSNPESAVGRTVAGGTIDIGAYELNGEVDAGAISGTADGGLSADDAGSAAASSGAPGAPGASGDGGTTPAAAAKSDDDGGCSCRSTPSAPTSGIGAFLALAWLLRRRRK